MNPVIKYIIHWDIIKTATFPYIFDVQFPVQVMRVGYGIMFGIDLHRPNSILLKRYQVEGGSGLDPLSSDVQLAKP